MKILKVLNLVIIFAMILSCSTSALAVNTPTSPTLHVDADGETLSSNLMPTGGGEHPYNPDYWNHPNNIFRANCYAYALNIFSDDTNDRHAGYIFEPGYKTGSYRLIASAPYKVDTMIAAVEADMQKLGRTIRSATYKEKPGRNEYKVAFVLMADEGLFHWYRQDSNGYWSHKLGLTKVYNTDASGNLITDPQTCDRKYPSVNYNVWGGYYIISK